MATVKIAISDDDPEFASKLANKIKIDLLLIEASNLLHQTFKERWAVYHGKDWDEDSAESVTKFITGCGQKLFKRLGKLQKELILKKNVQHWDNALVADILMKVDFCEGKGIDKVETEHLENLKSVRNRVAHGSPAGISDVELEELWSTAEPIVVYLGGSREKTQQLKNSANVADFENQNASTINTENSSRATKLLSIGNDLHKRNEFGHAIDAFTKAISLDGLSQVDRGVLYSKRAGAHLGFGIARLNKGLKKGRSADDSFHRALSDAEGTVRLRPAWFEGYFVAGRAYHILRKYAKAVMNFDWALSLAPGNEEIQSARDGSRSKLGVLGISRPTSRTMRGPSDFEKDKDFIRETFVAMHLRHTLSDDPEFYFLHEVNVSGRRLKRRDFPTQGMNPAAFLTLVTSCMETFNRNRGELGKGTVDHNPALWVEIAVKKIQAAVDAVEGGDAVGIIKFRNGCCNVEGCPISIMYDAVVDEYFDK